MTRLTDHAYWAGHLAARVAYKAVGAYAATLEAASVLTTKAADLADAIVDGWDDAIAQAEEEALAPYREAGTVATAEEMAERIILGQLAEAETGGE